MGTGAIHWEIYQDRYKRDSSLCDPNEILTVFIDTHMKVSFPHRTIVDVPNDDYAVRICLDAFIEDNHLDRNAITCDPHRCNPGSWFRLTIEAKN